ncbi:MAG TPA: hypothetical protein VGU24_03325 [Microvirga sp.]|nr:hypothetical protein [Microvirga sp.]
MRQEFGSQLPSNSSTGSRLSRLVALTGSHAATGVLLLHAALAAAMWMFFGSNATSGEKGLYTVYIQLDLLRTAGQRFGLGAAAALLALLAIGLTCYLSQSRRTALANTIGWLAWIVAVLAGAASLWWLMRGIAVALISVNWVAV